MTPFLLPVFFILACCTSSIASDLLFQDAGIDHRGSQSRYWFAFDEAPPVYYSRQAGKKFVVDVYGVRPEAIALEKLSRLGNDISWVADTAPLPMITLVFSLPHSQRTAVFPVGDLLFVETVAEDEKQLWKLPNSSEIGLSLYQFNGGEELVFTLPDSSSRWLFRDNGTRFSVELFANGLFFPDTGFPLSSQFLSKFHQTTLPAAPFSPEAVSLFDFALKKNTTITPRYLPYNLVIRMEKP